MKIDTNEISISGHGQETPSKKPGLDALILGTALKYPTVRFHKGEIRDVDLSSDGEH